MPPHLLLHPVFDKAKAATGVADGKVVYCFDCHAVVEHSSERHCRFCGKLFSRDSIDEHEDDCQQKSLREGSIDRNLLDWQQAGPILLDAIEEIDWAVASEKPEKFRKSLIEYGRRLSPWKRNAMTDSRS
jgi:hypothetical protein